jgi:non-canonical purine NTP pyrophosphatase (RdgB/HAM1 family)
MMVAPAGILEAVVYADDLDAALAFYNGILELPVVTSDPGRHVFFRCGSAMLLVFNPYATAVAPAKSALPVPPHGAHGACHVCFRAGAGEIAMWRQRLTAAGIAIESEFEWPRGGRSIYVRDPAGNSIEFAEPRIWGLPARRLQRGMRVVVASHNEGKVREMADLLAPHGLEVVSAGALSLPEPQETGTSFIANAVLKAEAAASASSLPAIADDSGLSVDALDGAPGIHSARWAGPDKDFSLAMRNVEEKLQAKGALAPLQRQAHFVCALAIAWPDGDRAVFEGRVDGTLVWPPRGTSGFGYDPMFLPDGHELTFGEMDAHAKHAISHRARAFRQLAEAVFDDTC